MKRFFILASAAIVALASCAKTEVVSTNGPQEIAFRQITNPITKANALATTVALGVYAHQDAALYFDNTSFTHNGTDWTGGRYWPFDNSALDFTVYAPYNNNTGTAFDATNKILTLGQVTAAEALYYGTQRYDDVTKPQNNASYAVTLKHVSSKLSVSVKGTDNVFKLKSLVLNTPIKTGDVDVNYSASPATVTVENNPTPTKEDITFLSSASTVLTSTATQIGDVAYVLPGTQTKFTIVFEQYTNGIDKEQKLEFTREIDLSDAEWVANKQYHYTIEITADEIHLTATIDDWDTPVVEEGLNNGSMTIPA